MLSYTDLAVTVAEADAYVAARALSGWPDVEADKTAALRRGQDYIAREYNGRWVEEWTEAPEVVQNAICEAALVEAANVGALSPVVKEADAKVLTEVKGIRWERIPGRGGVEGMRPRLLHVEALLSGVVKSGNVKWLGRA